MVKLSVVGFVFFLAVMQTGCASDGPKPVPLADGVEGLNQKTYSETKWKVWMDLDEDKLQRQVSQELCWAACVRMIQLLNDGQSMTQQQLHGKHILTLPSSQREVGFQGEIVDAMAGGFVRNSRTVMSSISSITPT